MIDWDKGHFNGRRALLAEAARGSAWALVGLDVAGSLSAAGSVVYRAGREEVGVVTYACWSPTGKRSLALAQVRRPHHRKNADLRVEIYALRGLQYDKPRPRALAHGPAPLSTATTPTPRPSSACRSPDPTRGAPPRVRR